MIGGGGESHAISPEVAETRNNIGLCHLVSVDMDYWDRVQKIWVCRSPWSPEKIPQAYATSGGFEQLQKLQ